jgi:hypothetical protein
MMKKIEKKLSPAVARAFEPPPREPQRAERQRSSASGRRQVLRALERECGLPQGILARSLKRDDSE